MITFHTIGDSHASTIVWGFTVDGFTIVCHTDYARTCAWFGITKPPVESFGVKKEDWVCFCFGEVDCRNNIGEYLDDYRQLIDKIVENYFYAMSQYEAARVFVFNVPPTVRQSTIPGVVTPAFNGTDDQRLEFTRYMNECFRRKCEEYHFVFFDVYDKYADSEGYFNLVYRDDCFHIANPVYLIEFLNKQLNG